jgi:benzodiazapine receptor
MHNRLRQIVTLLAILATIIVNILANALPFNGLSTGEISDRFKAYFVPAGYVFSIWGVIYLGLIAFAIYQALPQQQRNPRLQRIGFLPVITALANMAWIVLWHYEVFLWTVPVMLVLLVSLILTYLRLDIGRVRPTVLERWSVDIPTSIYLGWITVATIANITAVLDFVRWNGWGIAPEIWTIIILAIATLLAAIVSLSRRDTAYLLVLVWAFVGIAIKHNGVTWVTTGAFIAALLVAGLILWNLLRVFQRPQTTG